MQLWRALAGILHTKGGDSCLWALMITDVKKGDVVADTPDHHENNDIPEEAPWRCLMLNSAVNRSVQLGFILVMLTAGATVFRPVDDSWQRRTPPLPSPPLPRCFCGGSRSADQLSFLPGLSECQRPHRWWLTRGDTCWLQVKSVPK